MTIFLHIFLLIFGIVLLLSSSGQPDNWKNMTAILKVTLPENWWYGILG